MGWSYVISSMIPGFLLHKDTTLDGKKAIFGILHRATLTLFVLTFYSLTNMLAMPMPVPMHLLMTPTC